ncbi:hypothetical protein GGI42DRAFT_102830 [Trichoderma sp. SZMC 28013]
MELVILRSWEGTTQLEAIWDFLFIYLFVKVRWLNGTHRIVRASVLFFVIIIFRPFCVWTLDSFHPTGCPIYRLLKGERKRDLGDGFPACACLCLLWTYISMSCVKAGRHHILSFEAICFGRLYLMSFCCFYFLTYLNDTIYWH